MQKKKLGVETGYEAIQKLHRNEYLVIGKELKLLNLGLLMLTNTKYPCSESSYTYQYHHIPSICSKSHYSLRFSQEPTYEKAAGEVNIHREWSSCYLIYSEKVCNWYDVMYVKNLRSVESWKLYVYYMYPQTVDM